MAAGKHPDFTHAVASLQAQSAAVNGGDGAGKPPAATGEAKPNLLPGRLGDPTMTLGTEPRLDARLRALFAGIGMARHNITPATVALGENPTEEALTESIAGDEALGMAGFAGVAAMLPADEAETAVVMETRTVPGGDGQDMLVYVYRSPKHTGPLPAVVYYHGGGMVMFATMNPVGDRWCRALAVAGAVVVMPDFRNAYTDKGRHPFPAGLNDCAAAARYVYANKDDLGVSRVVIHGESGGGNFSIATALKANREGWVKEIAGVFATVPYISNAYGWSREEQLRHFPSLVECEGYGINIAHCAYLAHYYSPEEHDQKNPLAWPWHATDEELKGLPPHVLQMDELDPLRDEGVAFGRRLAAVGVPVDAKINIGGTHATSLVWRLAVPDKTQASVRDIVAFAHSL